MARSRAQAISSAARSSRQLRRFYLSINLDKVFGTHTGKQAMTANEKPRMRPFLARFSGPGLLNHTRSSADFITTTFESRFSVHTRGGQRGRPKPMSALGR